MPITRTPSDLMLAEDARNRAMLIRMYSYFFIAGAVLSYITIAIPHAGPAWDVPTLILATMSLAGGLLARWRSAQFTSVPALFVLSSFGTVLISLAIALSPSESPAKAFFYVFVSVFSFYFLPPVASVLQLGTIAVAFGAALWYLDPSYDPVEFWIISIGALAVMGVVAHVLRTRVSGLITSLSDAAMREPLTGLLNRRGLHAHIEQNAWPENVTLISCDVDYFQEVNDTFGHAFGDSVLIDLAVLMEELVADIPGAVCGRNGGVEFVVLLPDLDLEGSEAFAERIRSRIEEWFGNAGTDLTFSLGVAHAPTHGSDEEALFDAADIALYAAKQFGRNRTVTFDEGLRAVMPKAAERRAAEREIHIATLATLAEVLDLRHSGTSDHSQTVGSYAEATARELNLSEQQIERVRIAGLLHDIGKIGIPDSILLKPSSLTDEEFGRMKSHPVIGARILSAMDLTDIREWVLYHHERPDGRGYPRGLAGDEIPLGAAILAIADTYEAMTADRIYRDGLSPEVARAELVAGRGTQFQPEAVDAFLRVLDRAAADAEADAQITAGIEPSVERDDRDDQLAA